MDCCLKSNRYVCEKYTKILCIQYIFDSIINYRTAQQGFLIKKGPVKAPGKTLVSVVKKLQWWKSFLL